MGWKTFDNTFDKIKNGSSIRPCKVVYHNHHWFDYLNYNGNRLLHKSSYTDKVQLKFNTSFLGSNEFYFMLTKILCFFISQFVVHENIAFSSKKEYIFQTLYVSFCWLLLTQCLILSIWLIFPKRYQWKCVITNTPSVVMSHKKNTFDLQFQHP